MLVNLANKIKEEYSHLKECYSTLIVYKDDMFLRLSEISVQKPAALLELVQFYITSTSDVEK
jgi:hypothetical protein